MLMLFSVDFILIVCGWCLFFFVGEVGGVLLVVCFWWCFVGDVLLVVFVWWFVSGVIC